jgi:predicted MPP superfamily phosphohydrolase
MTIGKYNYKVIKQRIFFPDLPDAFDGFTITHISDVHSGSFDNPEKINYAIDLVNEQDSDIILFTGDIVNTHATEMHPWIDTFNRIKPHAYGKYSVLGNHDYGEYIDWPTQRERRRKFYCNQKALWRHRFPVVAKRAYLYSKGDGALVGVENWGKNFKQAGDLQKAATTTVKIRFQSVDEP